MSVFIHSYALHPFLFVGIDSLKIVVFANDANSFAV